MLHLIVKVKMYQFYSYNGENFIFQTLLKRSKNRLLFTSSYNTVGSIGIFLNKIIHICFILHILKAVLQRVLRELDGEIANREEGPLYNNSSIETTHENFGF